jgi:ribonucleoside-diphosphate reductase alpha chain
MFTNQRFEPAGMTDDPEIRFATSLVDYIFRRLAVEYLPYGKRAELGVLTVHERIQPTLPGVEEEVTPMQLSQQLRHPELDDPVAPEPTAPVERFAPMSSRAAEARRTTEQVICHVCGDLMKRAGTCHVCESCGATSGCS